VVGSGEDSPAAAENRPEVEEKGRFVGSGLEVEGNGRSLTILGKR
jgi:hypothetical protein